MEKAQVGNGGDGQRQAAQHLVIDKQVVLLGGVVELIAREGVVENAASHEAVPQVQGLAGAEQKQQ